MLLLYCIDTQECANMQNEVCKLTNCDIHYITISNYSINVTSYVHTDILCMYRIHMSTLCIYTLLVLKHYVYKHMFDCLP